MQTVTTPYTKFAATTGTWDAVDADSIDGGLVATTATPTGEITIIPNPNTGSIIVIPVTGQPRTVTIGGIIYQQVAVNPAPGQFTYNATTGNITVHLNSLPDSVIPVTDPILIQDNIIPIKYGYFRGERLLDFVMSDEIGSDIIVFLESISACGENGLIVEMQYPKGGLPTASCEVQILNSDIDTAMAILTDTNVLETTINIYGIPFYLKPFTTTINELRTAINLRLEFESIYSVRSQYNILDQLIYLAPQDPIILQPESLTQLADNNGATVSAPLIKVTSKTEDINEQRALRDLIESSALILGGFVDYSQLNGVQITLNSNTPILNLPDNISILPEVTISANGIPGAGIVDGVLLASPWIYRAWQPDTSGLILDEEVDTIPENTGEGMTSVLIGDPDTEPTTPSKKIAGDGYIYTDNSEIDNFPTAAQNPSSVAYPQGFNKSSWQEITSGGFKISQSNGERWGWEIISPQVWSYIDPPLPGRPDEKFTLEPLWSYTPPSYEAHWKKVGKWNLNVDFDSEGYPIQEYEVGMKRMQARAEGDQRTAAQLDYESDKLAYEAGLLQEEAEGLTGDDKLAKEAEAADKLKLSEEKAREISLYQYYDVPYTKLTRKYYQRLATADPNIKESDRPAYFLQREISTESGFIFVPNPVLGEPPIMVGETVESATTVLSTAGGYQIAKSTRRVDSQGESAREEPREYVKGLPSPAPRLPTRWRQRPPIEPEKPENSYFIHFSTPLGTKFVGFYQANRESVSIQGLVSPGLTYNAFLNMCRNENLESETTSLDTPWFREIAPGDRAWFRGKLWQCTSISRRDRIQSSGLVQCLSYSSEWGSWLAGLSLNAYVLPIREVN